MNSSKLIISLTRRSQQHSRIIIDPLPVLYVYDHCPYCVRVRLALGFKNIKHTIHFLANDEVDIPTRLVGKKMVPILYLANEYIAMGESMDIVHKLDNDIQYGPTNSILAGSNRTDISGWFHQNQNLLSTLLFPRIIKTGILPEFHSLDARLTYIQNHPIPPYTCAKWKGDGTSKNPGVTMENKVKAYQKAMNDYKDSNIQTLNKKLEKLSEMIESDFFCTEGGFSLDDIDIWPHLRSMTIITGVIWPDKLRNYVENLSVLADICLYDCVAN